ncbi:MAG TPA: amidohydrolase family protein [Actinomycetota bacterium]|nr:amidohydrolase family protein [Actinomycetota bacterium]
MTTSPSFVVDAGAALVSAELDLVEDVRISIDDGIVASVDKRPDRDAPARPATVDASDLLVVPGFVDAHVHIGLADPTAVLEGGVTAVRDLGWPPARIRALIEAPGHAGPLVTAAGQILTAEGGYPTRAAWAPKGTGREVGHARDAAAAVAEQIDLGASIIKIALNPEAGPVLDTPTLTAVVEAAHEKGLEVTGHISGLDQLERALDVGVDELAHMLMSPESIPDEIVERMVEAGMVVVPTLSIRFDDQAAAIENTARFLAAGGHVVYGTDLGNEGPNPGIDRREVDALQRAGMSARAIIRAATVDAARRLGLTSKGSIAKGMDADLVALPINAPSEAASLTDVRMVWREGRRAR